MGRPMNTAETMCLLALELMPKGKEMTMAERTFYTAVLEYHETMYRQGTEKIMSDKEMLLKSLEEFADGNDQDSGGDTQQDFVY